MILASILCLNLLKGINMEDKRCCGSGTCIINAEGVCWCGQQWDGEKMVFILTKTNDTIEAE